MEAAPEQGFVEMLFLSDRGSYALNAEVLCVSEDMGILELICHYSKFKITGWYVRPGSSLRASTQEGEPVTSSYTSC